MQTTTVLVTLAVDIEIDTELPVNFLDDKVLGSVQNAVVRAVNLNMDQEDFDFQGLDGVYPLRVAGKWAAHEVTPE